jgi:acyl-CoA reductase-like NAD-dependent aldehyde dehydrogenase
MSFESHNPATGDRLGVYPEHDAAETEQRLQLVWEGWQHWSRRPLSERRAFLVRLADLLEERAQDYGRLITLEMGKPIAEAVGEVKKAASGARHFAAAAESYLAREEIAGTPAHIIHQSIGPIFGIMPWNLPFWQVLRFFIPTALIGNTVLVKHAETVQGSAEALEQLVRDAGGPPGLYVNLAIQRDAAAAVIADRRIRAVTVTGSVAAGRAVAAEAGRHGKKVVLELGGSDPFIVLEDADLAKAVQLGVVSRYSNNAQSCIAAKRFLVAAPLVEAFTEAFVAQAAALPMGDPLQEGVKLGPLARPDLRANVHRQVQEAAKAGARVLTGGTLPEGPGNFYPPTVLIGLPPDAAIAQEEFFGPVAMIFSFETDEEAIRLANASEFGLGAAVWSRDIGRAQNVANQIEAGAVFINDFVRSDPRAPFGGVKASGFGRELGELGAHELSNAKLVWQGA